MHPASCILIIFKALRQLGLRALLLNALYKIGLVSGYYRSLEPGRFRLPSNPVPVVPIPARERLLEVLGHWGRIELLKQADEIVDGKFRAFGGEPVGLKLTGDWPLSHWTLYERGRIKLDGDIKFIWEPARFGWAYILGRAYILTQDDKYREVFWNYFESFTNANPPNLGPHWMNGQEVAIRLMALAWSAQVFGESSVSSTAMVDSKAAERSERIIGAMAAHAERIPPTLIYARSQDNNHLLTEAAALYTAGRVLDNSKWRAVGWHWLNWSLQKQISGYGEYIQHSTNYHRLVLQTALWVNSIRDQEWPYPTTQALTRAAHWLFSMLDPASGHTPNLGANDGALILPLSPVPFNDFRPTVQAAARAFLRTGLPAGVWDEMCLWLGLPASGHTSDSDAYLTDHLRGRNSWGYLRASRFKSHLSHMDQLHFDLWWRGLNLTPDPGTYLYNAEAPWNNPLVSTRVHNTVTVDGRDQMTRGSRFLTLDWFPAFSSSVLEPDENISGRVVAHHRGYQRLGIYHERTVTVYRDERWQVLDHLIPQRSSAHKFRLHWLLLDGMWEIQMREASIELRIKSSGGWITQLMSVQPSALNPELIVSIVRAGELLYGHRDVQPFEGWASPTYGVKVPALSWAVEASSDSRVIFTTEFIFSK
jgi:Heparinase II/III-like protein/Heparinase II/III N-terminus